jgi:hypothetical protein
MRTLLCCLVVSSLPALAQHTPREQVRPAMHHYDRASALPVIMGERAERIAASLRTDLLGWRVEGAGYELTCDHVSTNCGVAMLRSKAWHEPKAGALLHGESALPWRGTRVVLAADLRTGSVDDGASLVILALDAEGRTVGSARSERLRGTTTFGWREVSFEVPQQAERVLVGVELVGRGAVHVREVVFDDAELVATRRR